MYKVHVRAKNPKQVVDHDNEPDIEVDLLTAEAEFRTEPGGNKVALIESIRWKREQRHWSGSTGDRDGSDSGSRQNCRSVIGQFVILHVI